MRRLASFFLVVGLFFPVGWLSGPPVMAQSCQDFAERQVALSEKQLDRDNFSAALRVMNVALSNDCRIPVVENQVADVLEAWYEDARNRGSTRQMKDVIRAVSAQDVLSADDRSELQARIRATIEAQITDAFRAGDARRTHSLCRTYDAYSDRTFALNRACGQSAREAGALNAAIERYEALLADWSTDQSALTRKEAYEELKALYLITTRFDRGFQTAKRLAQQDPTTDNLLASLTAVRGRYLEPIARVARALFDGSVPDAARQHVRREFGTVQFPPYVQAIYTLDASGAPAYAFTGESSVSPPSSFLLQRGAGPVSLLLADAADRAWLLARTDGGAFVIQFNRQTTPAENVILEGLLEDAQNDNRWASLYEREFAATAPATGSAVATMLGGAYLSAVPTGEFAEVFDAVSLLTYHCIQDRSGSIAISHGFSRDDIQYESGVWDRTSETPALFHHAVTYKNASVREVVWPIYDGEQWSGVVRVGIAEPSPS